MALQLSCMGSKGEMMVVVSSSQLHFLHNFRILCCITSSSYSSSAFPVLIFFNLKIKYPFLWGLSEISHKKQLVGQMGIYTFRFLPSTCSCWRYCLSILSQSRTVLGHSCFSSTKLKKFPSNFLANAVGVGSVKKHSPM